MVLKNNEQTHLRPVLALHGYVCSLPEETGRYTCKFAVQEGSIQITRRSYDAMAGMWCQPPVAGTPETYILSAGEEAEITFEDSLHDWEPDIIYIANHSYLKQAAFTCSYKKEALEGAGSKLVLPERTGKRRQSRQEGRVM